MLTPQDIQDVKFDRSMKGYDKEQVEEFLDTVQSDYTVLYKENATLKGKMRVLVDKIEEYRAVDEQMRKAFFNAQVTAQETVAKAQAEAEQILRTARSQADDRVNDLKAQILMEEKRLEMAKAECRKYAAMMKAMLEDNIRIIGENIDRVDALMELSVLEVAGEGHTAAPAAQVEPVVEPMAEETPAEPKDELDGDTKRLMEDTFDLEKELAKAAAAPARERLVIEDSTRFKLTDLRFGKDYKDEE
ncbi:MAG: DivIVA domain-containing protein [Clostridia bacterium]|nr:DivIVA domain-containing protein [Clostridia bacterium]MBR5284667.1 DivIVA domain-containing protein [Clostridia bacterium]